MGCKELNFDDFFVLRNSQGFGDLVCPGLDINDDGSPTLASTDRRRQGLRSRRGSRGVLRSAP
ncbi:MAG: hypothetical protein JW808_09915 [Victivallales bacterium]|nr:hypothetical protein [Victivallales bacterium]